MRARGHDAGDDYTLELLTEALDAFHFEPSARKPNAHVLGRKSRADKLLEPGV
jgi:hypothetical protein